MSAWLSIALLSSVQAQEYPTCPQVVDELRGPELLRSLSLDLRGVVPSEDEYATLDGDQVPEDLLREYLDSPEFAQQVVRHHRDLLWPNVSDIRLISNRQRLKLEEDRWYRYLVAPHYRGAAIDCGDFEAEWDTNGELITVPGPESGSVQEGWVWVTPYWDSEPIKVCAFGAQEPRVSPLGTECDTYDSRYDPYCGCGPNLAWCDIPDLGHNGDVANPPVHKALAGDIEHRVARIIEQDLSYLELLTGRTAYVNGPLVHFYRYQTQAPAHVRFNELPVDLELLPELAYTDTETWVPVELGPEQSGILTSPLYLMKYQTRRGRTNRFYDKFLCQPFTPPEGGLSDLDNPDVSLDLTQRAGCKYCHAVMEPAGAHWARWSEYGAGYLDPDEFPAFDPDCAWCAESGESCSEECDKYYVVDPLSSEEDPYVGWLSSYEFLEERHWDNAQAGPSLLVERGVADGRLPRCVASTTAEWLLGRELADGEEPWVEHLSAVFVASDFDYTELVYEIVSSDSYRSVR